MKRFALLILTVFVFSLTACTADSVRETENTYGIDKDKAVPPGEKGDGIDKDKVVPPGEKKGGN